MLRLCSESSRSYPGRSVRLAVASCESALHGNMQGDRAEVSRGHSRCGHRQWRYDDWKRATTRICGGYRGGLTPLKGRT